MADKKKASETLTPEEIEKARKSGAGGRQMRGVKVKVDNAGEIFKRLMAYVGRRYKFHLAVVVICILTAALANVQGTMFMRTLIDSYITPLIGSENPDYSPLLCPMHTRESWSLSLRGLCAIFARRCSSIWRVFRSDISIPTVMAT